MSTFEQRWTAVRKKELGVRCSLENQEFRAGISAARSRLMWISRHDYSLALFMVIAPFGITPLGALLFPAILFSHYAFFYQCLSPMEERVFRESNSIPKSILIRKALSSETRMFSLPFFAILFTPRNLLDPRDPKEVKAILAHEFIHRQRHDGDLIVWFLATSC
jgi:hypothetical protein